MWLATLPLPCVKAALLASLMLDADAWPSSLLMVVVVAAAAVF